MLQLRTIVKHRLTGKVGVILPTWYPLPGDDPLSVIFEGETIPQMLSEANRDEFEVMGQVEPIPTEAGCGGKSAEACIFFVSIGRGPECLRYTASHWALAFRLTWRAKREPTAPYPQCQRNGVHHNLDA